MLKVKIRLTPKQIRELQPFQERVEIDLLKNDKAPSNIDERGGILAQVHPDCGYMTVVYLYGGSKTRQVQAAIQDALKAEVSRAVA